MLIVSNKTFVRNGNKTMNYNDFVQLAFYGEGLDTLEGLCINVDDLEEEVFEALQESDENNEVTYFTLNKEINKKNFINKNIEDWSDIIDSSNNSYVNNDKINNNENTITTNSSDDISIKKDNDDEFSLDIPNFNESIIVGDNSGTFDNIKSRNEIIKKERDNIINLMDEEDNEDDDIDDFRETNVPKNGRIIVFGSSKGGTGKTFTSIISTYRYAKTHPNERIALVDFDITDGQVGISIHKIKPTVRQYLTSYQKGFRDFKTMQHFAVRNLNNFPSNIDFYLAPRSGVLIDNDEFWLNIIQNCMENYDVIVFDTGINYLNIAPISYVYKIADKINLITTTSIKSYTSVSKQISNLKGEKKNPIFTQEDDLASRLNVIITQMTDRNQMNGDIYNRLNKKCSVIATFGVLTDSITEAEYCGNWGIFDNPESYLINQALDKIME